MWDDDIAVYTLQLLQAVTGNPKTEFASWQ
jgi:hypothetical protein